MKEGLFDNFSILRHCIISISRTPPICLTYMNVLEQFFFFPLLFIHPPSLIQSQLPTLSSSLQSSETNKSRNRPEEKRILSHTKYFRARNRAEYFMQCIIWLDVPSFREIYDRASLPVGSIFRYARECFTSPLGFYFPSVNPVPYPRNILAVKYVCMYMYARHTRRHVSVGDAATWANLPARCRARFPLMQLYV